MSGPLAAAVTGYCLVFAVIEAMGCPTMNVRNEAVAIRLAFGQSCFVVDRFFDRDRVAVEQSMDCPSCPTVKRW